ncbi:MAG TPA: hypothetical protein VIR03_00270, partial [Candidatus Saccharimonadales bacterium]
SAGGRFDSLYITGCKAAWNTGNTGPLIYSTSKYIMRQGSVFGNAYAGGQTDAEIIDLSNIPIIRFQASLGVADVTDEFVSMKSTAGPVRVSAEGQILTNTYFEATPATYGSGSPEGVVTARVGSYYYDLNATNGAVMWVKAANVGNTGWRVVNGDTNWRDIVVWDATGTYSTGSLAASFAPRSGQAGKVSVRRINDRVHVRMVNIQANASLTSGTLYQLVASMPTGFVSGSGAVVAVGLIASAGSVQATADLSLRPYAALASGAVVAGAAPIEIEYAVTPGYAWPATLPGVAGSA